MADGSRQTGSRLWRVPLKRWVGMTRITSREAAANTSVARPGPHVAPRQRLDIYDFAVSIFGSDDAGRGHGQRLARGRKLAGEISRDVDPAAPDLFENETKYPGVKI
jgi:hypothetical protein